MKKIGFIGFGNMAKAISKGILQSKIVPNNNVFIFDINSDAMNSAKEQGFNLCKSEIDITNTCDLVFLCVKPQSFTELLPVITSNLKNSPVFLSIAAGINIATLELAFGSKTPIARAMPNTPLMLSAGVTALCKNKNVSDIDFSFIKDIFSSVGSVYELNEDKFNDIINVNGSTPAYIYLFAKTIAEYAQQNDIDYLLALNMFCDTMIGSAKMLKESGKSPEELINMVSSKGGTTVAALQEFERTGFTESLRAGMLACVKRAKELNK